MCIRDSDIVSNLPGIRTEHYNAELLHPFLREMFEHLSLIHI